MPPQPTSPPPPRNLVHHVKCYYKNVKGSLSLSSCLSKSWAIMQIRVWTHTLRDLHMGYGTSAIGNAEFRFSFNLRGTYCVGIFMKKNILLLSLKLKMFSLPECELGLTRFKKYIYSCTKRWFFENSHLGLLKKKIEIKHGIIVEEWRKWMREKIEGQKNDYLIFHHRMIIFSQTLLKLREEGFFLCNFCRKYIGYDVFDIPWLSTV